MKTKTPEEREARRQAVNERNRRYYAEHKAEKLEQNRAYRKAHPEKMREYQRRYRAKYAERVRAYQNAYYKAHAEEYRRYRITSELNKYRREKAIREAKNNGNEK